ncbi:hypothetical protein M3919_003852 [Vibrio parahaemolyticus]|nr:hypothetical protein [Vibrio parahaemolyticus]
MRLLLLLSALVVSSVTLGKTTISQESQDKAKQMADVVNQKMGSGEEIRRFASTPLTSDAQLSTFDGNTKFDFSLQCKGTNRFLNMMVQPRNNGNVVLRTIQQDTTMDGKYDTIQTPNYEMSGICSNGFIKCANPATGEGCVSRQWVTNDSALLATKVVPLSDLGGCYCISGKCGSNLTWSNLDLILRDLSMGAANTLSQVNPFFAITDVKVQDVSVTISGSNGTSCSAATADGVSGTPEMQEVANANYKKNSQKLTQDGYAAADNNVWYKNIKDRVGNNNQVNRSCKITRHLDYEDLKLEDVIALDSGSVSGGGIYTIDNNTVRIVLGRESSKEPIFSYKKQKCEHSDGHQICEWWTEPAKFSNSVEKVSFFLKRPEMIESAVIQKTNFDGFMQILLNGDVLWNGPFGDWTDKTGFPSIRTEEPIGLNKELNKDFLPSLSDVGNHEFKVRLSVVENGSGYAVGTIKTKDLCVIKDDLMMNECRVEQDDEDCTLLEEVVDGVTTFRNGHSTGLSPMPSKGRNLCGQDQVRDWWERKRTYKCNTDYNADWDEGIKRVNTVKTTINEEGKYTDRITYNDGNVVYKNDKVDFFDMNSSSCIKSCKVRKKRPAPEIALNSPTSDSQRTDDAYDYFYYQCSTDDVCPSGDGEEVMKACGCLNDFSEASAAMQVLRFVGKDMICSNGERGQLE